MAGLSIRSKPKARPEKAETPSPAAVKSSDANCLVSPGARFEGDFSSSENIRIDGAVVGQIRCERKLVIGEEGRVEDKVISAETVVMGRIKGNVEVSGTLQLMGTAHIEGDIQAKFLVVEEGAAYNGKCQVSGK